MMPDASGRFRGSGWSRAREDGWERAFELRVRDLERQMYDDPGELTIEMGKPYVDYETWEFVSPFRIIFPDVDE